MQTKHLPESMCCGFVNAELKAELIKVVILYKHY